MTTAVTTLVDRVRDLVDDYGDATTVLDEAVSSAGATSITTEDCLDVSDGAWLNVDYEMLRVRAGASTSAPYTIPVRRGQRGTTAATHLDTALVIHNPKYSNFQILKALNGALGKLSKVVTDSTTLTIVDDQYAYDVPATIDVVRRIEIENSDETEQFFVIRNWEMLDNNTFRIFGLYSNTRNIRVVGTARFTAMATSGNVDSSYPDSDENAINYLVYEAVGQLLMSRQAKIAGRDSFEGLTDAFAQSQPDNSLRTARYYLAEADKYKRLARTKCPILQEPCSPTQNPTRSYLSRV